MWIDTHAHLDGETYEDDLAAVIERAVEAKLRHILNIGCTPESAREVIAQAQAIPGISTVIGMHPHYTNQWNPEAEAQYRALFDDRERNRIVAVGEIGLDFHYDYSPREQQKEGFIAQLKMAYEYDLPVVIHSREAHAETLEILTAARVGGYLRTERTGVFHCYSGSPEFAQRILPLGFYFGFDGPITFKNARMPVAAAAAIPADRLMIETDCPYLTPTPFRGKRNEPAYLAYIGAKLAEIRGMTVADCAEMTSRNALELFGPYLETRLAAVSETK